MKKSISHSVFFLSSVTTFIWCYWRFKFRTNALWDLRVYTRAVADYRSGINPYLSHVELPFMYHPFILRILVAIDHLIPITIFLVCFYFFTLIYFFYSLQRFFTFDSIRLKEKVSKYGLIFLISLGLGGSSLVAFVSGNISTFMHLFLTGLLLQLFISGSKIRLNLYIISVSFAMLIKPYFVFYLFLLLLCMRVFTALALSFSSIALTFSIWFLGQKFQPSLYKDFLDRIKFVTLERGDLGFSAFSILKRRLGETLALSIHLSLIASIVIIAIYFSRKYKMEIREFMVWYLPVPFAIMIFANPRLKEYDIVILLLLLVTWLTLRGGSSGQDALLVAFGLFLLRSFLFLVQTPLKIKIHDSLIYLKYWEFLITIMLLIWMLSIPPKKIKVEIE